MLLSLFIDNLSTALTYLRLAKQRAKCENALKRYEKCVYLCFKRSACWDNWSFFIFPLGVIIRNAYYGYIGITKSQFSLLKSFLKLSYNRAHGCMNFNDLHTVLHELNLRSLCVHTYKFIRTYINSWSRTPPIFHNRFL